MPEFDPTCLPDSLSDDTWRVIGDLYDEHHRLERRHRGGQSTADIESALDRLLAGRHETDDPSYRRHNSLNKACYSRHRAARQHTAAAQRLADAPLIRTGPHLRNAIGDPLNPPGGEDTAAAATLRASLAQLRVAIRSQPRTGTLERVLEELVQEVPTAHLPARIGVSQSTIDRSVRRLRELARPLIAA